MILSPTVPFNPTGDFIPNTEPRNYPHGTDTIDTYVLGHLLNLIGEVHPAPPKSEAVVMVGKNKRKNFIPRTILKASPPYEALPYNPYSSYQNPLKAYNASKSYVMDAENQPCSVVTHRTDNNLDYETTHSGLFDTELCRHIANKTSPIISNKVQSKLTKISPYLASQKSFIIPWLNESHGCEDELIPLDLSHRKGSERNGSDSSPTCSYDQDQPYPNNFVEASDTSSHLNYYEIGDQVLRNHLNTPLSGPAKGPNLKVCTRKKFEHIYPSKPLNDYMTPDFKPDSMVITSENISRTKRMSSDSRGSRINSRNITDDISGTDLGSTSRILPELLLLGSSQKVRNLAKVQQYKMVQDEVSSCPTPHSLYGSQDKLAKPLLNTSSTCSQSRAIVSSPRSTFSTMQSPPTCHTPALRMLGDTDHFLPVEPKMKSALDVKNDFFIRRILKDVSSLSSVRGEQSKRKEMVGDYLSKGIHGTGANPLSSNKTTSNKGRGNITLVKNNNANNTEYSYFTSKSSENKLDVRSTNRCSKMDASWQNYLIKCEKEIACNKFVDEVKRCYLSGMEHYHCNGGLETCKWAYHTKESLKDHCRSHEQADTVFESSFKQYNIDQPCIFPSCDYYMKEIHFHCVWAGCLDGFAAMEHAARRQHYKMHQHATWSQISDDPIHTTSNFQTTNIFHTGKRKRGRPPKNRILDTPLQNTIAYAFESGSLCPVKLKDKQSINDNNYHPDLNRGTSMNYCTGRYTNSDLEARYDVDVENNSPSLIKINHQNLEMMLPQYKFGEFDLNLKEINRSTYSTHNFRLSNFLKHEVIDEEAHQESECQGPKDMSIDYDRQKQVKYHRPGSSHPGIPWVPTAVPYKRFASDSHNESRQRGTPIRTLHLNHKNTVPSIFPKTSHQPNHRGTLKADVTKKDHTLGRAQIPRPSIDSYKNQTVNGPIYSEFIVTSQTSLIQTGVYDPDLASKGGYISTLSRDKIGNRISSPHHPKSVPTPTSITETKGCKSFTTTESTAVASRQLPVNKVTYNMEKMAAKRKNSKNQAYKSLCITFMPYKRAPKTRKKVKANEEHEFNT